MKLFIKLLCLSLVLSSVMIFAGCGEDENELVATTAAIEETTEDSKMNITEQTDLSKLHTIDYENGDDFAGAWVITEGDGAKYKSFVYVFDGHQKAYLVIGTTGYYEKYQLETKKDDSGNTINTLTLQLMFGINGVYKYEFSDDKNTVTLTKTDDNSVTKMQKSASFSYVPIPDPEPVIDEALLGAWSDGNGEYYYFDKSGIMYNSINDLNFTYAKYSAKDGKVTSTFTTNKEETVTTDYKVDGETLTYGTDKYTRIPVKDLK